MLFLSNMIKMKEKCKFYRVMLESPQTLKTDQKAAILTLFHQLYIFSVILSYSN